MSLEEAALLAASLEDASRRPRHKTFCPHAPWPRQKEFLELESFEALYGGAAGGGKSDALLMVALQCITVPGYAALLLRRTYRDLALSGAIMDRAGEWMRGTTARWNPQDHRWTIPGGGSLQFGYADSEGDIHRYKSAEYQMIGVDEVTEWPEGWYTFLASRIRRKSYGASAIVPLRLRCASNPGGIGHEWVRRRFAIPEGSIPLDTIVSDHGDRVFVPARLDDNPAIDKTTYEKSLSRLTTIQQAQFREGRWVRDASGLVYAYDDGRNGIEFAPELEYHVIGVDYGFVDATAFSVVGWRKNDPVTYIVRAFGRKGITPSGAAQVCKDLEKEYKAVQMVGDVGGLGKGYAEEARDRWNLPIEPAEKQNKRGYIDLLNGSLATSMVKVVRPACQELISEWKELPWKDEDRQAESPGFPNHCADATLYAWRASKSWGERVPEEAPGAGTREALQKEHERDKERRRKAVAEAFDKKGWQVYDRRVRVTR